MSRVVEVAVGSEFVLVSSPVGIDFDPEVEIDFGNAVLKEVEHVAPGLNAELFDFGSFRSDEDFFLRVFVDKNGGVDVVGDCVVVEASDDDLRRVRNFFGVDFENVLSNDFCRKKPGWTIGESVSIEERW